MADLNGGIVGTNKSRADLGHIAEPLRGLAVPVADLHLDPANARRHGDRNVEAIAASLSRWGQRAPLVVQRDGMVVRAGNGRLEAAKRLGWTHVAALVVDEGSVEATAFAIADNRTAELAEWDDEALAALLDSMDVDVLAATGFQPGELDALLADLSPTEIVEDQVPEPPEEPVTRPGDLWVLGGHRVLCGDSIHSICVERVVDGARFDMLLTDPPYNVSYAGHVGSPRERIENDTHEHSAFVDLLTRSLGLASGVMKPGAAFYVWHADTERLAFLTALSACGLRVRQALVWVKNSMVFGRQDYQWQHEPCLYGWKDGAAHGWYSDRTQTTVLRFDRPSRSPEHPTMKPVALIAYLIGNSTAPHGVVYDPFLGSGTTLIAAEQLGRTCYGLEIEPRYCDVIVRRWENLTGRTAERIDADGEACEGMTEPEVANG